MVAPGGVDRRARGSHRLVEARRLPGVPSLEPGLWRARHRLLRGVLAAHLPLLGLASLLLGLGARHTAVEVALPTAALVLASWSRVPRALREVAVAAGLVGTAAVVVHLAGGATEAHFHYFVVLALLPLYQTWPPLVTALAVVVLQHGVAGALVPGGVFADEAAQEHPWRYALLHGAAVLAAGAASALVVALHERERVRLTEERDAARAAEERALRDLASRDPLTGLPNRREATRCLQAAVAGSGAGVLYLDLDGFKSVNDVGGHEAGDALLRDLSRAMAASVRPGDVLARLGGDEFVAVCPGLLEPDALDGAAERLRATVLEVAGARGVGVGVSVGRALALPGEDPADVLSRADAAMYRVKRRRPAAAPGELRVVALPDTGARTG